MPAFAAPSCAPFCAPPIAFIEATLTMLPRWPPSIIALAAACPQRQAPTRLSWITAVTP